MFTSKKGIEVVEHSLLNFSLGVWCIGTVLRCGYKPLNTINMSEPEMWLLRVVFQCLLF